MREYASDVGFRSIKDIATDIIMQWLEEAKNDTDLPPTSVLGGTVFDSDNISTYWSDPRQLLTWWKNNVERTNKRSYYLKEATYTGNDANKILNSTFCSKVLALSNDILQKKKIVKQAAKKKETKDHSNKITKIKKRKVQQIDETSAQPINGDGHEVLTNLLNVAMAYNDTNENKTNTPKINDDDKIYNTKRKANDTITNNNKPKRKSSRSSLMTEEQEQFFLSLSSLSSPPSSTFSTPSSLSKFVW